MQLRFDDQIHAVEILHRHPHLLLRIGSRIYRVTTAGRAGDGRQTLMIDDEPVAIARASDGDSRFLRINGQTHCITPFNAGAETDGGSARSELRAPMPGAVIEVHVAAGDHVGAGDPLITIESMKLQTVLGSPRAGQIAEIGVTAGEVFGKDQPLVRLVEEASAHDA